MTRGSDQCLFLFPPSEWKKLSKQVGELGLSKSDTRGLNRFLFAGAQETEVDRNGRILVPDFLRQFAGIGQKVVFAGVYDRVELWNQKTWERYKQKLEKQGEVFAEQLGQNNEL
jgi:MraZ protein